MVTKDSQTDYKNAIALIDKNLKALESRAAVALDLASSLALLTREVAEEMKMIGERLTAMETRLAKLKQVD